MAMLALPGGALAADAVIALDAGGYDKQEVVILPGEKVTFNDSTLTRSVRFEDGTTICDGVLAETCERTFPAAGQYKFYEPSEPGCTSYDACSGTPAFRGVVIVDGPPSVSSLNGPATAVRGQAIGFGATASDPNGDSIAAYNWDFGDGTSTGTADGSTSHAYTTAGTFTVTLSVSDSRGNVSPSTSIQVTVTAPDTDADGVIDDLDKCANLAAATPDGCPLVAPIIPAELVAGATAARSLGLQAALTSGVSTVFNCSDRCSGIFTVTRGGRTLASTTALLATAGSKLVTVKFSASAKRSLARLRSARLLLQVLVTDALGRTQTEKATITLKKTKLRTSKVPALGISDQQASTFSDPLFQVMRMRYARLMTPWNAITTEPERLDAWLQAARANNVRPLVAFERERGSECPKRPCRFPSKGQYTRAFKAFRKQYPWVRDISPWNEVNSATQPTGKRPELAALYYNVVRANCRGCTIVAADLLDSSNVRRYTAAFLKRAKGKPRLWGLHNYSDTNRFRSRGTQALLESVKGTVWLTETGGVVKFVTQDGKVALPKSEKRAKKAIDYMFRLAEQNAKRIKRIYVYQWKVNNIFDRFDAGVVRPDGKPRPSYDVLTLNASIARKR